MTDGELLKRFVERRDEPAFSELVHRHGSMVLGVCRRVLANDHDAEDAFQATFFVLARRASTIMPRASVGSWLFGVARRTALKARGAAVRRRIREAQASEEPTAATAHNDVWREILPRLDDALSSLPDTYRLPIILCH